MDVFVFKHRHLKLIFDDVKKAKCEKQEKTVYIDLNFAHFLLNLRLLNAHLNLPSMFLIHLTYHFKLF